MSVHSRQEHIIDCDSNPVFSFSFGRVVGHEKGGKLVWDATTVRPFRREWFGMRPSVGGLELWKMSSGSPTLNACVLDYLLAHPDLIPPEWKSSYVLFRGTVFLDVVDGFFYAAALVWSDILQKWVAEPVFLTTNDDGRGLERLTEFRS